MVSVIMASYNAAKYINEQLESIFINISDKDELIIVDDCSTDGTFELISEAAKKHNNMKVFRNDFNQGVNKTFEKALSLTAGDYIVISDDDDIWSSDKIKKTLPYFNNKKVSMVVHDCILIDEDMNTLYDSYFALRSTKSGLIRTILKPCYRGAVMCFKKDLLEHLLPFPSKMDMFYDEWISLMAEKYGKVIIHNEILSKWRRLPKSVSKVNIDTDYQSPNRFTLFFKRINHRFKKILLLLRR